MSIVTTVGRDLAYLKLKLRSDAARAHKPEPAVAVHFHPEGWAELMHEADSSAHVCFDPARLSGHARAEFDGSLVSTDASLPRRMAVFLVGADVVGQCRFPERDD